MKKKTLREIAKTILVVALAFAVMVLIIGLTGCREAEIANYNLSKSADYFNVERRITVYNARTDNMIFTLEGFFSLSNDETDELVITCKVGANEYKKNYIYLTENTLYVVEDITGTHVDPFHYSLTWHYDIIPVDIDVKH